jgi:hypothetical protein
LPHAAAQKKQPSYNRYEVREKDFWKERGAGTEEFQIDTGGGFLHRPNGNATPASAAQKPGAKSTPSGIALISYNAIGNHASQATRFDVGACTILDTVQLLGEVLFSLSSTFRTSSNAGSHGAIPIILVPNAPTAVLTLFNAVEFLEHGKYVPL